MTALLEKPLKRVSPLKAGRSSRTKASTNPVTFVDPSGLEWRVNGEREFSSTAEFAEYLAGAEAGSISKLEFAGHGSGSSQNMLNSNDPSRVDLLKNYMVVNDQGTIDLMHDGKVLDPRWIKDLQRALRPDATAIFGGCHSGESSSDGIALRFSLVFSGTRTWGTPEICRYRDYPNAAGSTAKREISPGVFEGVTPGGNWNLFVGGTRLYNPRGENGYFSGPSVFR